MGLRPPPQATATATGYSPLRPSSLCHPVHVKAPPWGNSLSREAGNLDSSCVPASSSLCAPEQVPAPLWISVSMSTQWGLHKEGLLRVLLC